MKYTPQFSRELQELDHMVILQKEMDLYEHKKRHARKMISLHYHDRSKLREYEQEFRGIVRQMKMLEKQMSATHEAINCPRMMIHRYMELYQVSIPSVTRTLNLPSYSISQYLLQGIITPQNKPFIYWAIRNFRLDANRYWNLIESVGHEAS